MWGRYCATANPEGQERDRIQIWAPTQILTAVDAVVCQILSDIRKNTEVQKKIQIQIQNSNSGCMHLYVSLTLTRHEKEIQIHIDSNWSLLRSKALKYYLDIYCEYFRVLHRFKHWPQNLKKSKIKTIQIETLSLSSNLSPLVPLGQPKTGPGRPNHSRAPKWMKTDSLYDSKNHKKLTQSPNTPPTPSRLLLPGCWPPLRPPAGLQVGKGWGDLHPRTV